MLKQIEYFYGHTLEVRDSLIDHHLAGKGVFLSCKRQKIVLPGTLLGLFGGIINPPGNALPEAPIGGIKPYLERPDGTWIEYETEIPYPLPPLGTSIIDFVENCS